uniref:LOW QUALITY PROTEIN: FAD-dependent oxidoreductase domain-containing protein 1-like n=1 Tax=Styela clava TaxID=7725 RepID=UPI00193A71B4|nr:LOW QUALITY PROTEIN: FAD-dependent oxidoreductase domain-containing protein 1-like [Styela clava]
MMADRVKILLGRCLSRKVGNVLNRSSSIQKERTFASLCQSCNYKRHAVKQPHTQPLRDYHEYYSPYSPDEVYDIHEFGDAGPLICHNNEVEYLIVGGGVMGLSMAFNLWRETENFTLLKASKYMAPITAVVERDPTMTKASTGLSLGGVRQQFSHPANVRLSMKSAEYLRDIKYHLGLAGHDVPDIQFQPQGYLFLATKDGADKLMKNYETQIAQGAKVMVMTQNKLKELFPWINVEGIELATYGLENEGWFDPWSLLTALKSKLTSFGTEYIHGEVVGFKKEILRNSAVFLPHGSPADLTDNIDGVYIKVPHVDKPVFVKARIVINCAGAWSKKIAELAGIGAKNPLCDHEIMDTPLPVEPRKRWVYNFHCPDGPVFDCPMLIDPSGAYFRREGFGGNYLCGMSPPDDDSIDHSNLDVNYEFFHEEVWPRLAHRVPVFEKLKLKSAWAGYYEYNTFDQNAVIGPHPYYKGLHFLTGFSGHGIQQAMGASACLAELITTGPGDLCNQIDISTFSFDRFVINRPIKEINIV